MATLLRKVIASVVCSIALLLPHRLRIIYCEILGWSMQLIFWAYISILKFIIKSLKVGKIKTQ